MMYHARVRSFARSSIHLSAFVYVCLCSLARSVAANYQIDIASSNNLFHPIFALLRVEREFAPPVMCKGLWILANFILINKLAGNTNMQV